MQQKYLFIMFMIRMEKKLDELKGTPKECDNYKNYVNDTK